MRIVEPQIIQDLLTGELKSEHLVTYRKPVKSTAMIYANPDAALNSEELAYEVTSDLHEEVAGALNWGVTIMYPITVDGECCMTRGHFHQDMTQPEYYLCSAGEGHLLCWDGKDDLLIHHMTPGALVYIEGKYAHRLINTGDEVFKVVACWAVLAGHNYEAIEKSGFPVRAFKRNGELVWESQK
jgi:glucose-6-phosphate isomerase, archaeal